MQIKIMSALKNMTAVFFTSEIEIEFLELLKNQLPQNKNHSERLNFDLHFHP